MTEKNGQPVLTELARILSKYVSILVTNKYGRTKDCYEIGTCLTLILEMGRRKNNPNVSLPFPGKKLKDEKQQSNYYKTEVSCIHALWFENSV